MYVCMYVCMHVCIYMWVFIVCRYRYTQPYVCTYFYICPKYVCINGMLLEVPRRALQLGARSSSVGAPGRRRGATAERPRSVRRTFVLEI